MAEKDVKEQINETPENSVGVDINSDDSLSGSTHLNEPVEDESILEKTKAELKEAKDKYKL